MQLLKKINNNFAVARDSSGKIVIVSGKGIGFERMPCELKDLSRINHTYYNVANRFISQIELIPEDIVELTSEVVKYANVHLKKELNPNLFFTLADHIHFVIERSRNGIHFNYGITYEIKYLYPEEMRIAELVVNLINKKYGCSLPIDEVAIIAMHILEAENRSTPKQDITEIQKIVKQIVEIITERLCVTFDESGFNYYRFVSHIQYLLDRKDKKTPLSSSNQKIFESIIVEFPEIYNCTLEIKDYFINELDWEISNEELLYLILHINRLCSKEDCNQ